MLMNSTHKSLQGCTCGNEQRHSIIAALSEQNTVVIKKSAVSSCMSEASLEGLIYYDCAVGFKFRGIFCFELYFTC